MKRLFGNVLGALSVVLLLSPSVALSEVRIDLRNGRTLRADSCRESGDSYFCTRMGGTFEIPKEDVSGIRSRPDSEESDFVEPTNAEPQEAAGEKKAESAAAQEVPPAAPAAAPAAAPQRRGPGDSDPLAERKIELMREREALVKERQVLQEEIRKSPDWMFPGQFDELQKRAADLDTRLNKFNEAVTELNRAEGKEPPQ